MLQIVGVVWVVVAMLLLSRVALVHERHLVIPLTPSSPENPTCVGKGLCLHAHRCVFSLISVVHLIFVVVFARSELSFVYNIRILPLVVSMSVLLVHVRRFKVNWFIRDKVLVVHEQIWVMEVVAHFSSWMS